MGKLTLSAMESIALELGFKVLTQPKRGEEPTEKSRIIFKKDTAKERDLAIREQVIQEMMERRGITREEALKILANPF